MMTMLALGLFTVAMTAIGAVFWATLLPALPRIAELLATDVEAAQLMPAVPARRQVVTVRQARLVPTLSAGSWRAAA